MRPVLSTLAFLTACATTPPTEAPMAPTEPPVSDLQPAPDPDPATPEVEAAADATQAPLVEYGDQARQALGQRVRVRGTAENAKLAAMVMAPGFSVYCMQWDSWPDHVYGQQVEVTGVLNQTDQFQARVSKDGSISQGSAGADLILTEASFVVIEGE